MTSRTKAEVGELVAQRRNELKKDAAALARYADVDPKTLGSLERGERWPRDRSRSRIEEALGWQVGSLEALRSGHDAIPIPPEKAAEHYPGRAQHEMMMALLDAIGALHKLIDLALTQQNMEVLKSAGSVTSTLTDLLVVVRGDDPDTTDAAIAMRDAAATASEYALAARTEADPKEDAIE